MNAKKGIFRILALICLVPLPTVAANHGSVGPVQEFQSGFGVSSWISAGSLAFFATLSPSSAYPPQPGIEGLVRSDGTWEGTFSIDPRISKGAAGHVKLAERQGNLIFFTCGKASDLADRGLWRSDGTVAGTFPVTEGLSLAFDTSIPEIPVIETVPERSLVFFSASPREGSGNFELWATDGTPEGTRLVKDVNPEGSSSPRHMIVFAGRLFFFANTPQGRELWSSDGTPEGTERVRNFQELGSGTPILAQAGGALFILGQTATEAEIWRSDGTEAGTEWVLKVPGTLHKHQAAGRHLFVVAREERVQGLQEIWAVDGGTGEAVRVLWPHAIQDSQFLAVGDNVAFFLETDFGREPWWSDGTPQGTHLIADICPGPCSSFKYFSGTFGGRAVFLADDGLTGGEPWLTDGTPAGTFRLADLCPGDCWSDLASQEINGWLALKSNGRIWISDGTPNGVWPVGNDLGGAMVALADRLIVSEVPQGVPSGPIMLEMLPVTAPAPPQGGWLETSRVPGFRFKVRIDGQTVGVQEAACTPGTLCVSGALRGRSEVFLRVSGSDPEPSLVKLTPSLVEVWVRQNTGGLLRYYRMDAAGPTGSILTGILDRDGFEAAAGSSDAIGEAKGPKTPQPPGKWIESKTVPGFRVQARLTAGGKSRILRREPCMTETFCLSGAVPGLTDLLIRVPGPKPNGYFWPTMARFTAATLEVWVQQRKTGKVRYYRLNPPPAGSSQLDGFFDRLGFKK